jgi:hypothetical protein
LRIGQSYASEDADHLHEGSIFYTSCVVDLSGVMDILPFFERWKYDEEYQVRYRMSRADAITGNANNCWV